MGITVAAGSETSPNTTRIHLDLHSDPTVNYASYQNHVPLIRGLTLTNTTDDPLRDIEIAIRCEPAFAEPMRLRFERLDAREVRRIDAVDLKFQHKYLAELTEAERGRVIVEVSSAGAAIAEANHAIDVLAYDQWAGNRALPELLAAFSLPNNPAVDRLIHQAGEIISKAGSGLAMSGYQSKNRDDVWVRIPAMADSSTGDGGQRRSVATQVDGLFIRLSGMLQGRSLFAHRFS